MKRFAGLFFPLLLAGCAVTPPQTVVRSPLEFADWQLDGRIGLTHGNQGWHASLLWQESADGFQLKVAGPLGQGGFQVAGDGRAVTLIDADGQTSYAHNADALLLQATGWQLPATGLRYWVRGLPVPGVEAIEVYDDAGRLSRLTQTGWVINYDKYQSVEGVYLPTKLRLERADLAVRLVIGQWHLGPPVVKVP